MPGLPTRSAAAPFDLPILSRFISQAAAHGIAVSIVDVA